MKKERKTRRVQVTPRLHGYLVVVKEDDGTWRPRVFKHRGEVRPPFSVANLGIQGHGAHHVVLQVKEAFHEWGVREGWIVPLR